MGVSNGFNGKLYRLSTGSRTSWGDEVDGVNVGSAPASLVEVKNVKDITIDHEDDDADATTRGNRGYKATIGGLRGLSVEVPMEHDSTDTHYLAFLKAYATRTTIALAFLDGDKGTDGIHGTWADWSVLKMSKGEALAETQMTTWSLKPGYSAVPPELVAVGDD